MKTLQELYIADQTLCTNFLDSLNMQVSLIVDGISLQVYFNEERQKYEYHTHSDDLVIGPQISRLTKIFSKDLTDAITYLETKQEIVNRYKFLNFIIYDKELYLLSVMQLGDTKIIDDYTTIIDTANTLGVHAPLIIYRGRLCKDMQEKIITHIAFQASMDSNEFKNKFQAIFDDPRNNAFPHDTYLALPQINGIIFSVNFGDTIAHYKIEDEQIKQIKKQQTAARKLENESHKSDREYLVTLMNDWLLSKATVLDKSHFISMQKNFALMVKSPKVLMKLITAATKLPIRNNSQFMLQIDLLQPDLQALIRKHGTPMRTLIEQYLLTYYKHKELNYSDDVLANIKIIVDKL